jgi:hypothetical protein
MLEREARQERGGRGIPVEQQRVRQRKVKGGIARAFDDGRHHGRGAGLHPRKRVDALPGAAATAQAARRAQRQRHRAERQARCAEHPPMPRLHRVLLPDLVRATSLHRRLPAGALCLVCDGGDATTRTQLEEATQITLALRSVAKRYATSRLFPRCPAPSHSHRVGHEPLSGCSARCCRSSALSRRLPPPAMNL